MAEPEEPAPTERDALLGRAQTDVPAYGSRGGPPRERPVRKARVPGHRSPFTRVLIPTEKVDEVRDWLEGHGSALFEMHANDSKAQTNVSDLIISIPLPEDQLSSKDLLYALSLKTGLSYRRIKELRSAFLAHTTEEKEINEEEFGVFMASVGITRPLLTKLFFRMFDTDGSGRISFVEFASAAAIFLHKLPDSRLHALFNSVDERNSGVVSLDDIRRLAASLLGTSSDTFFRLLDSVWEVHFKRTEAVDRAGFETYVQSLLVFGKVVASLMQSLTPKSDLPTPPSSFLSRMDDLLLNGSAAATLQLARQQSAEEGLTLEAETGFSSAQIQQLQKGYNALLCAAGTEAANTDYIVQRFLNLTGEGGDTGEGMVDFSSYVRILAFLQTPDVTQRSHFAFKLIDCNGDGRISLEEMQEIFQAVTGDSSQRTSEVFIEVLDSEKTGHINADQFRQVYCWLNDDKTSYRTAIQQVSQLFSTVGSPASPFSPKSPTFQSRAPRGLCYTISMFFLICLIQVGGSVADMGLKAMFPSLLKGKVFTVTQVGGIGSGWFVGYMIGYIVIEKARVKLGLTRASLFGSVALLLGACLVSYGVLQGSFPITVGGYFVQGLFAGLLSTAQKAMLADTFKGSKDVFFYYNLYRSGVFLLSALFIPPMAALQPIDGLSIILGAAVVGFLATVLTTWLANSSTQLSTASVQGVVGMLYPADLFRGFSVWEALRSLPARTWAVFSSSLLMNYSMACFASFAAPYVESQGGYSTTLAVYWTLVTCCTCAFLTPVVPVFAKRYGHRLKILLAFTLLYPGSIALLAYTHVHPAVPSIMFGLAMNVSLPIRMSALTVGSRSKYATLLFAMQGVCMALGGIAGPNLFSHMVEWWGYHSAWFMLLCVECALVVSTVCEKLLDMRTGMQAVDKGSLTAMAQAFACD